jgi:uncharacterized protein (DUF2141 family)
MKIGQIIFVLALFIVLSAYGIHSNTGKLIVTIENCNSDKGKIYIALYNSSSTFMNVSKAVDKRVVDIRNKKAVIEFDNLAYGVYAFSCYHDENGNKKMDKNLFGIPTESYAFSNNARGTFGPPTFEKSSISIKSSVVRSNVSMK